ncbi:DUF1559 domain-containing protein [bacterium]|nr:MAG: DUF1559 domain-containing protein [bacterium]
MKRRRAGTLIDHAVTLAVWVVLFAILVPVFSRARNNARRATCQSNLKQICLALWQYTEDSDGVLPTRDWVSLTKPYAKEKDIFRCPVKNDGRGRGDYFFNARLLRRELGGISAPQSLILLGDGSDDSPVARFPTGWRTDESSPAWRHLEGANYAFGDGHVKWLKASRVKSTFRMVMP